MHTIRMPHCCTAQIVVGFGESRVAEGGSGMPSEDDINIALASKEDFYSSQGYAMLVATTNNEQKVANKVLLSRGYLHSRWMSKSMHSKTKVRLWWKPLHSVPIQYLKSS